MNVSVIGSEFEVMARASSRRLCTFASRPPQLLIANVQQPSQNGWPRSKRPNQRGKVEGRALVRDGPDYRLSSR